MRFDAEFLKTLDHLRLASSRALAGSGRGDRRSRRHGRGIEFADYRQYAQGDDVRHIDWKAYKRLNRLLLRLFDEEQDLRIYLLLDTSRSMAPHGKFDYAVRIAGALCYIGLAHLDRVSLLNFTGRLESETSTGHARHTIGRVFEELEALQADGETDLWRAMSDFVARSRRKGLAIVLSDFLDPAGCARPLKLLAAQGHEVVAVHVTAAVERTDATALDEVDLVDMETGSRRRLEVTPALARAYTTAWDNFDADVAKACAASQAEYVRADVSVPFERAVLHTFRTGRFLE